MLAFNEELNKMKIAGPVSKQQELDFWKSRENVYPQNREPIDRREGQLTQGIEQQTGLEELSLKYKDLVGNIGLYGDALKRKEIQDKVDIELMRLKVAVSDPANAAIVAQTKANIAYTVEMSGYQRELARVFKETDEPAKQYAETLAAIDALWGSGAINAVQEERAINLATEAFKKATDPMLEFSRGLQNEMVLLTKYGEALTVTKQVQQTSNELRAKGIILTTQEKDRLSELYFAMADAKIVQSDLNKLDEAGPAAINRLTLERIALSQALEKTTISYEQYRLELMKTSQAEAQLKLAKGDYNAADVLTATFSKFLANQKPIAKEITDLWANTFSNIANSAANSFAHAIVYGKNLGKAMQDVARQGLQEIIAGMIKMAAQQVLMAIRGKSSETSMTAATIAAQSAMTPVLAANAAFMDTITFGAAGAAGNFALAATVAFSKIVGAAAVSGQRDGGIVGMDAGGPVWGSGTSWSDSVLRRLSNGEFVVNAQATAVNRPALEAINAGARLSGGSGTMNVHVVHDGSTSIQTERVDANTIRIHARQAAEEVMHERAEHVISTAIMEPNSKVSKAIQRFTTAERRR